MRKYILIGIGGFVGAILRFLLKNTLWIASSPLPAATLLINISGSFVLGLFLTLAYEIWELEADLRLAAATGFLGAFTTFSTLCKETIGLFDMKQGLSFIVYPIVSVVFGLLAVYLGIALAKEFIQHRVKKDFNG